MVSLIYLSVNSNSSYTLPPKSNLVKADYSNSIRIAREESNPMVCDVCLIQIRINIDTYIYIYQKDTWETFAKDLGVEGFMLLVRACCFTTDQDTYGWLSGAQAPKTNVSLTHLR